MHHVLEALILGLVQGLTEFLPISSSAHLRILGEFLPGAQDPGAAFTAITQLGTETAVVVFFWRDIVRIVSHWFGSLTGRVPRNDPDARMGWLIIIGSVPIVVLGILFQDQIETTLPLALDRRDHAHRLRHHPRPRRLGRGEEPHARPPHGPARHRVRVRAGARADPRRLPLGRHHHGRALPRLRARGCGPLRLPARHPRGLRQRLLPARSRACGEPAVYGPIETAAATLVAFVVAIARHRVLHELHLASTASCRS